MQVFIDPSEDNKNVVGFDDDESDTITPEEQKEIDDQALRDSAGDEEMYGDSNED